MGLLPFVACLAQEDFIADTENGFKDLQLGKEVSKIQQSVTLVDIQLKTMRPDVITYRVTDTAYLEKDEFRFSDVQAEATKGKLTNIIWIKNGSDTLFFNSLMEHINTKYGEFQRTIRRGFQLIKQWYFEKVVIELLYNQLPDNRVNIRLSFSLRKNLK